MVDRNNNIINYFTSPLVQVAQRRNNINTITSTDNNSVDNINNRNNKFTPPAGIIFRIIINLINYSPPRCVRHAQLDRIILLHPRIIYSGSD